MIGNNYLIVLTMLPYNSSDDCHKRYNESRNCDKASQNAPFGPQMVVMTMSQTSQNYCFTWEQVFNLHVTFLAVDLTCW